MIICLPVSRFYPIWSHWMIPQEYPLSTVIISYHIRKATPSSLLPAFLLCLWNLYPETLSCEPCASLSPVSVITIIFQIPSKSMPWDRPPSRWASKPPASAPREDCNDWQGEGQREWREDSRTFCLFILRFLLLLSPGALDVTTSLKPLSSRLSAPHMILRSSSSITSCSQSGAAAAHGSHRRSHQGHWKFPCSPTSCPFCHPNWTKTKEERF